MQNLSFSLYNIRIVRATSRDKYAQLFVLGEKIRDIVRVRERKKKWNSSSNSSGEEISVEGEGNEEESAVHAICAISRRASASAAKTERNESVVLIDQARARKARDASGSISSRNLLFSSNRPFVFAGQSGVSGTSNITSNFAQHHPLP